MLLEFLTLKGQLYIALILTLTAIVYILYKSRGGKKLIATSSEQINPYSFIESPNITVVRIEMDKDVPLIDESIEVKAAMIWKFNEMKMMYAQDKKEEVVENETSIVDDILGNMNSAVTGDEEIGVRTERIHIEDDGEYTEGYYPADPGSDHSEIEDEEGAFEDAFDEIEDSELDELMNR